MKLPFQFRPSTSFFERIQRVQTIENRPTIVEEVLGALAYPKVQKAARSGVEPGLWFEDLVVLAQLVSGDVDIRPTRVDRDDDKYIVAPVEGRAAFVVSGDPHLSQCRV